MIYDAISIRQAVAVLNDLVKTDRDAMRRLIQQRVPCNEAMLNHPTAQALKINEGDEPTIGLLGVLNALFGIDAEGWGPIAAVFDGMGTLESFSIYTKAEREAWAQTIKNKAEAEDELHG